MNTLLLAHTAPFQWPVLLLAALVSAAVSIVGYWQNARSKRLDRQRQLFADAFRSVVEYREFVYKVRRRSPKADRSQITDSLSDVQAQLNLHSATLRIEAPSVADSYVTLVGETRRIVGPQISKAWERHPPSSGVEMRTHGLDLGELTVFEEAYMDSCNRHLHQRLKFARGSRRHRRDRQPEQLREPEANGGDLSAETIYEDSMDDRSTWRLMVALFRPWGVGLFLATVILGSWLSTTHQNLLSASLGDLLTPAAVMISAAIAIAVWIAGPQRHPRQGKRVTNPHDLLGMAWTFSWCAILGISLAVAFRTLPSDAPVDVSRILGGLALGLMGLVQIGLGRLLWLSLRSISRRLPEAPNRDRDSTG